MNPRPCCFRRTLSAVLFCFLLLLPLCSCQRSVEKDAHALEALLRQVYGEEYVFKLPGQQDYVRLLPGWDKHGDYGSLIPITATDTETAWNKPCWTVFEECDAIRREQDDEGLFTLRTEKSSYAAGENVIALLTNGSDTHLSYQPLVLDSLVDGRWYRVFSEPPGLVEYRLAPGDSQSFDIGEMLRSQPQFNWNAESGRYEVSPAKEFSYRRGTVWLRDEILLPAGRYRCYCRIDLPERDSILLVCEFDVSG